MHEYQRLLLEHMKKLSRSPKVYLRQNRWQPLSTSMMGLYKTTRDEAMKEVTIDGKKYNLVPVVENTKAQLHDFKLVVDRLNDEIDIEYKGYTVLSFTREGKFKLFGNIPDNIGLQVCSDGEILEE